MVLLDLTRDKIPEDAQYSTFYHGVKFENTLGKIFPSCLLKSKSRDRERRIDESIALTEEIIRTADPQLFRDHASDNLVDLYGLAKENAQTIRNHGNPQVITALNKLDQLAKYGIITQDSVRHILREHCVYLWDGDFRDMAENWGAQGYFKINLPEGAYFITGIEAIVPGVIPTKFIEKFYPSENTDIPNLKGILQQKGIELAKQV
jgi:hypothetical protein